VDQLPPFIRRLELGTEYIKTLWSGKEDYNRVIKGEGIRFWPVRAFNFMRVLLSFFYTCTLQLSHIH
jgi:hypothetical protein